MNEVADPDALVSSDDRPVDSNASTGALFSTTADADSIDRLEAIYLMLWTGLRSAARDVFAHAATESVLDMAAKVESYMQAWVDKYSLIKLASGEKLKLHMDCINGVGQVCPADEVQDIGGQCWVYIRAAVHGIQTGSSDPSEVVAVAVGDTFLYSPFFSQVTIYIYMRCTSGKQTIQAVYFFRYLSFWEQGNWGPRRIFHRMYPLRFLISKTPSA